MNSFQGAIEEIALILHRVRPGGTTDVVQWVDASAVPRDRQMILAQFKEGTWAHKTSDGKTVAGTYNAVGYLSVSTAKWSGGTHFRDVEKWAPIPGAE